MDKKGDYKWSIILSLILGLLVLGLSLFFIFGEFFTGEDTDIQICRQSIQLRSLLPEVDYAGLDVHSFKADFPLKCRTIVKTIERRDFENGAKEAKKIIAETMAECWALYSKGDSMAFPSEVFKTSSCVPCARIHLTEEAKEYMEKEKVVLSIRNSLDEKMKGQEYTYYNFLMNAGDKFSAFNFGNGVPFDLEGDEFSVVDADWFWETRTLTNKVNKNTYDARMSSVNISLPEFFNDKDGDLLISYGIVTVSEGRFGDYIPYLFYFQTGQKSKPFEEVQKGFVFNIPSALLGALQYPSKLFEPIFDFVGLDINMDDIRKSEVAFCESWEGIPA